jgi:hypothetical protein
VALLDSSYRGRLVFLGIVLVLVPAVLFVECLPRVILAAGLLHPRFIPEVHAFLWFLLVLGFFPYAAGSRPEVDETPLSSLSIQAEALQQAGEAVEDDAGWGDLDLTQQ